MSLPTNFFMGKGGGGGYAGYDFSSHTFSNAGATGRNGPSQAQLDATYSGLAWYSATRFRSDNGIQIWTVPATATYRFHINGGYGGRDKAIGAPASIIAEVPLIAGEEIKILVGQRGLPNYKEGSAAGGGGGTFVTYLNNTPILVAGGGGGADGVPRGGDASLTPEGGLSGDGGVVVTGGAGGHGANGAGGGGLTGNGASTSFDINPVITVNSPEGGLSFTNGGTGGQGYFEGGFGGGGGSAGTSFGGGGGGGYSGGAGGFGSGNDPDTGGGGSFVISTATNITKIHAASIDDPTSPLPDSAPDAGFVTITML